MWAALLLPFRVFLGEQRVPFPMVCGALSTWACAVDRSFLLVHWFTVGEGVEGQ